MAALVEALITQLIPLVLDKLTEELKQVTGARKEIEKLGVTFSDIQAAVDAAEQRQVVEDRAKISLENLKEVAYELEDLLDEWLTLVFKSQVVNDLVVEEEEEEEDEEEDGNGRKTKKKKMNNNNNNNNSYYYYFLLCPCSCLSKLPLYHNMGRRVKEIREKLEEVKERNQFLKEYDHHHQDRELIKIVEEERPMTSTEIDPSSIVGRRFDRNLVVEELLLSTSSSQQPQRKGIPVVSIVGMGGIGKTTLAQLVYRDPKVEKHFPTKIWVCVAKSFEKTRLAKAIIEGVDNNVPDFLEWNPLHRHLGMTMKGKKFLLVLDDVWNGSSAPAAWEDLKFSLDGGAEGSRVLLTTQDENVAEMMASSKPHGLGRLSDDDSWSLLRDIALSERSKEEIAMLESSGKEIAKKCNGLPLAVKSIGNFMRNKMTKEDWEDILKSETWKESLERNVVPALLFGYYALPSHLKRCFTYCAFLPRGYQIQKDVLIKLWMAQGFLVKTGRPTEELEKIGEDYFKNLVMPSFFQDFTKDDDGNIITCKMHDHLHYLAQSLTKNECLFMENTNNADDMSCCKTALLHSTLILTNNDDQDQDSIPHFFYGAAKLRTLKLFKSRWNSLTLPKDLCERFSRLRALDLSFTELDKLPQDIDKLIHLRYLDLSSARLEKLPDTVCKLYNLQTLILNDCGELNKLPDQMGELRNLRHLEIKKTPKLFYLPVAIGRLNSLHTLSKFCVGSQSGGCKIEELKELDLLKGHLEINGLKRVKNENGAQEAKLENKQLHSLCLDFEHDILIKKDDEKIMECVLEALQPCPRLKKLEIRCYLGSSFSSWMSVLSNLRILTLNDCKNCRKLPALGKLSSLEELRIENMDELELVGHEIYGIENSDDSSIETTFPRLRVLHIDGMLKLRGWYWKVQYGQSMPCLNHLFLQRCPNLKVLPENIFPSRLSKIYVTDCPELSWGTIMPAP